MKKKFSSITDKDIKGITIITPKPIPAPKSTTSHISYPNKRTYR